MSALNRPTSPFLSVYRLQSGSFFSIFSRITGIFLLCFILAPASLLHMSNTAMSSYVFYFFLFFVFKSQYTSLFFSFFIVTALSALLYHLLSATRYLFWTSEAGMQNDVFNLRDLRQTQSYFLLIPVVLVVLSWVVFMLI
jgi:succinate dehydrogenase cytochrome b556 subunit